MSIFEYDEELHMQQEREEHFAAGLVVSLLMEVLQRALCCGLFEWDDMIHNGPGCMIGAVAMGQLLRG